ncbi:MULTISPECIES: DUF3800 domain-containing protein [Bacillaceae]|uniref:DUF3800 domain-containing protein n=1 Tax=Bacillaceae TaxID=186817 RepID=UPI0018CC8C8D|nr:MULTISPECIES: DUF3800 domain-containing protein [Bacillaceae]MBG9446727.1 hypothetical protein [Cytobacillus firmus]MCM3361271.1 DUF3800 domain-containing protein [Niallia sp. MER TA 168]
MNRYSVFFDEYGNTGNNLSDINQPYYIVSGWVIPNDLTNPIRESITKSLKSYNPHLKELKGKKLLETRKGRQFLCQLMMQMLDIGCIPILSINHKDFVAAAKLSYLLDDCIDPAVLHSYNLMVSAESRNKFAHLLLEMCPKEVGKFANLLRNPELETLRELFNEIYLNLSKRRLKYASLFNQDLIDFTEAIWSLQNDLNSQPRKAASAINLPCFTSLLSLLEDFGRKNDLNIDVYHDEVVQFREAYKNYSEYMSNGTDFHFTLDNGFTAWYDLKHTTYKGMKKSIEDPLIQIADLLCSTLQALIVNEEDIESTKDLAIVGFIAMSYSINYNTLHFMMKDERLKKLTQYWKQVAEEQFINR